MNVTNFFISSSEQITSNLRGAGVYKIPIQGWTDTAGTWGFVSSTDYIFYSVKINTSETNGDSSYIDILLPKGDYTLYMFTRKNTDRGIMKVTHGSTTIASTDLYAAVGATAQVTGTFTIADDTTATRFAVTCDGKNGASSSYKIPIGEIAIVRS